MASNFMRYVFQAGNKRIPIYAVSEKQAKFFFYKMNEAKGTKSYAKIVDITGCYPGDLIPVWNVDQNQFVDRMA